MENEVKELEDSFIDKLSKKLKMNAVFLKDFRRASRNTKTLILVIVINIIMSLITLGSMFLTEFNYVIGSSESYAARYDIYMMVIMVEMGLVTIVSPGLTCGAITNERERQTLEMLLCTKMTHFQIVKGKLYSALMDIILIFISSLPIIFTVYAYGGLSLADMVYAFMAYMLIGFLFCSYGLFCSSVCKSTMSSTVLAYILIIFSYAMIGIVIMIISNMIIYDYYLNSVKDYKDIIWAELVSLLAMTSPAFLIGNFVTNVNMDLLYFVDEYATETNQKCHEWFIFLSEHSKIFSGILTFLLGVLYLWISSKLINTVKKTKKKKKA